MITYLKGIVKKTGDFHTVLDINGVGFLVNTSNITSNSLKIGDDVELLTELVIRENSWQIYGFINNIERDLFIIINKVQGVGAKASLSILSAIKYDILGEVIRSKNHSALCSADGIGEKLASRIVNELYKKIPEHLIVNNEISLNEDKKVSHDDIQQDVVSALLNFGFKQYEIKKAMLDINLDENKDFETLLRLTLGKLKN